MQVHYFGETQEQQNEIENIISHCEKNQLCDSNIRINDFNAESYQVICITDARYSEVFNNINPLLKFVIFLPQDILEENEDYSPLYEELSIDLALLSVFLVFLWPI